MTSDGLTHRAGYACNVSPTSSSSTRGRTFCDSVSLMFLCYCSVKLLMFAFYYVLFLVEQDKNVEAFGVFKI